jgi:hypothetical protein
MAGKIEWIEDFDAALKRAEAEEMHILLDFFNPG